MTTFIMSLKDYKEYFKSNTEIEEDLEESIFLRIESIDNENDEGYEYSIKWTNKNNDNENGFKYGINTSSIFALMSSSWNYEDEEDE